MGAVLPTIFAKKNPFPCLSLLWDPWLSTADEHEVVSGSHECSGITGGQGAECPPKTSDWEISAGLPGKKEARGKKKRVKG